MHKPTISRRDFLKLSATLTASTIIKPALELAPTRLSANPEAKNVLLILFDAFSAKHINFHGYQRETMPFLSNLLEKATVYHNHYSGSSFTTPGTGSLLTGRHVWEHGAIKLVSKTREEFTTRNIFSFFDDYYKLGYSHNPYADLLLTQFQNAISHHEYFQSLFLEQQTAWEKFWIETFLQNDYDIAQLFDSLLKDTSVDGYIYSLMFSKFFREKEFNIPPEITENFPRGIPLAGKQFPFILEDAINWSMAQLSTLPQPFLGYFHFFPPHDPYNTRKEFLDRFLEDGYQPAAKPPDAYALRERAITPQRELVFRQKYDEFILYADAEFNRLFTYLDQQGILENTIVVLTSDHGEIIERGVHGHNLPYLYDPVVRIPLVIFEPGQNQRRDIFSPTSCIDLVPTLLDYTGHDVPPALPGRILPPFKTSETENSAPVFSFFGSSNKDDSHLTIATLMMRKQNIKVIRYSGYTNLRRFHVRAENINIPSNNPDPEFLVFDLENDPEELYNLASQPTAEIQAYIDELEQFYRDNVEYPDRNLTV